MNSADKKGYSGTLIYTKEKPLNVVYGINEKYNDEGRVITLEYPTFYLINAYVPNAQDGLKRIEIESRLTPEEYIEEFKKKYNVAHFVHFKTIREKNYLLADAAFYCYNKITSEVPP